MAYVYVIESTRDQTWYTGIALDPVRRLDDHNKGKNRFTKGHTPWKIIFTQLLPDWKQARKHEKYLKSSAGKRWLKKFLNDHGGITSSLPG